MFSFAFNLLVVSVALASPGATNISTPNISTLVPVGDDVNKPHPTFPCPQSVNITKQSEPSLHVSWPIGGSTVTTSNSSAIVSGPFFDPKSQVIAGSFQESDLWSSADFSEGTTTVSYSGVFDGIDFRCHFNVTFIADATCRDEKSFAECKAISDNRQCLVNGQQCKKSCHLCNARDFLGILLNTHECWVAWPFDKDYQVFSLSLFPFLIGIVLVIGSVPALVGYWGWALEQNWTEAGAHPQSEAGLRRRVYPEDQAVEIEELVVNGQEHDEHVELRKESESPICPCPKRSVQDPCFKRCTFGCIDWMCCCSCCPDKEETVKPFFIRGNVESPGGDFIDLWILQKALGLKVKLRKTIYYQFGSLLVLGFVVVKYLLVAQVADKFQWADMWRKGGWTDIVTGNSLLLSPLMTVDLWFMLWMFMYTRTLKREEKGGSVVFFYVVFFLGLLAEIVHVATWPYFAIIWLLYTSFFMLAILFMCVPFLLLFTGIFVCIYKCLNCCFGCGRSKKVLLCCFFFLCFGAYYLCSTFALWVIVAIAMDVKPGTHQLQRGDRQNGYSVCVPKQASSAVAIWFAWSPALWLIFDKVKPAMAAQASQIRDTVSGVGMEAVEKLDHAIDTTEEVVGQGDEDE